MSVMTDLYRGKTQRFKVTFKGEQHFVNTKTMDMALSIVRTKIMAGGDRDPALGSFEEFKAAAGVMPSLRY